MNCGKCQHSHEVHSTIANKRCKMPGCKCTGLIDLSPAKVETIITQTKQQPTMTESPAYEQEYQAINRRTKRAIAEKYNFR